MSEKENGRYEPIERAERADAIEMSKEIRDVLGHLHRIRASTRLLSHKPYSEVGSELSDAISDISATVIALDAEIDRRLREDYVLSREKTPEV